VGNINGIMTADAGLGETGSSFLVGKDQKLRSLDRSDEASIILTTDRKSVAVEAALRGETGSAEMIDFKGDTAIASYSPVEIDGLDWVIVSEIDEHEALAASNTLAMTLLVLGAAIAGIVALVGFFVSVKLVKPIAPIVARAQQIAKGDLSGELLPIKSNDELGTLTTAMNEMTNSLRDVIRGVSGASREVAAASSQIAASSEEIAAGMNEQSSQVHRVSAAIEEMAASVIEVAQKSADAARSAEDAGKLATDGGSVVQQTIDGMNSISDAVTRSADSVKELGKRGEQIGQIVAVINDIADQTNLLALNAAIEAARAGEHGRGFAVVADEVRKLADRTTQATEEIGQSIKAIQKETGEAVSRMNAGTTQVQQGAQRAGEAGQSLQRIVSSSREVAAMIQSIAAAAEEQSSASDEVAKNVEQISQVSQQTAEGGKQAAQAAFQLATKAEELQSLCSRFKL
jgi:methyl-accepting chemotaxis protein